MRGVRIIKRNQRTSGNMEGHLNGRKLYWRRRKIQSRDSASKRKARVKRVIEEETDHQDDVMKASPGVN